MESTLQLTRFGLNSFRRRTLAGNDGRGTNVEFKEWQPLPYFGAVAEERAEKPVAGPGVYLRLAEESGWEKAGMALLAVSALVAVAFGMSDQAALVENWAVFQNGIASFLQ